MKRWWMLLLTVAAVLCLLAGCAGQNVPDGGAASVPETPDPSVQISTEPAVPAEPEQPSVPEAPAEPEKPALTPEEAAILQARRDVAEQYMREMATVLWRAEEDIVYTLKSNKTPDEVSATDQLVIRAGQLYQGVIYSYGYSTTDAFLAFAGEPADNGVYSVSGLAWQAVSGGSKYARIGNDCSGALTTAWSQVGAAVPINSTKLMCEKYGFLKVGEYESDPNENADTHLVTTVQNGEQVMYRAYARLQKADGIVRRKGSTGHARMIVSVDVVYNADGTIDGNKSTATILEQTSSELRKGIKHYDPALGEEVYEIYGIDKKFTFSQLCVDGYLPITCKELVDPAPVAEPVVQDSVVEHSGRTILSGTISCNWFIDAVTVTITDSAGKEAQKASLNATRTAVKAFDMQKFAEDVPEAVLGSVDPGALTPGNYHCTTVCRLSTGQEFTVRDFDFTV